MLGTPPKAPGSPAVRPVPTSTNSTGSPPTRGPSPWPLATSAIVPTTWAATSATVQPLHRDGAAHCLSSRDRTSWRNDSSSGGKPIEVSWRDRVMRIPPCPFTCRLPASIVRMSMTVNDKEGDKGHPRRTQAERTATTREALLSAARELFAEHGFAGTPREDIVERAGVTRGAL